MKINIQLFASKIYALSIYSNDGNTLLYNNASFSMSSPDGVTVTSTGIKINGTQVYTYSGQYTFLGVSATANSTTASYSSEAILQPTSGSGETFIYYIVEVNLPKYLDLDGASRFLTNIKSNFQTKLVSGTNIKTVNNNSLLGSGDITISGEPSAYLKSASVSGSTLTLTKKDNTTVTFTDTGEANVQSDWNETNTSSDAYINNKPTIPTVNNSTITVTQGGTTKGSFTLNQGSNSTIALDAGGTATTVKVDGTSITSNNEANIQTINSNYNASTNKIATASDIPTFSYNSTTKTLTITTSGS